MVLIVTSMATGSMQFQVVKWNRGKGVCAIPIDSDLAAGWAKHADTVTNYRALSGLCGWSQWKTIPGVVGICLNQLVIGGRHRIEPPW